MFGFAEMQVLSFPDLYAGKIVAALDRQHPRDLFDIRALLANERIDDALRAAFIVHLLSHNRPMAEVLAVRPKDISTEFVAGFRGMTAAPVTREELVAARSALTGIIVGGMPAAHRSFLVSFEAGELHWALLAVPKADRLPAVRWRQQNLAKLTPKQARRIGRADSSRSRSAYDTLPDLPVYRAELQAAQTPQALIGNSMGAAD